ncbi:hypothetical protein FJ251_03950 [bacterium]|nr:hypothetical protein [bacterium]
MRGPSLILLALLAGAAGVAHAEAPAPVRVERKASDAGETPTLRWLNANRDFLRARLDLLRQRALPASGEAAALDERSLLLARLLGEIDAARDSLRIESALLADSSAASLGALGELAARLDRFDALLDGQSRRLATLDSLLAGEQETALLVLLKGLPPALEPTSLTIHDRDGDSWQVTLGEAERAALRRGGLVEVLHEYVEPRLHRLEFAFGGGGRLSVAAQTPRDRLTLLQLDLGALDSEADLSAVTATIWQD